MILGRLFTRLFELGVVVVATSNVAPCDLIKTGSTVLFLPFIALVEQKVDIVRLDARTDFRLESLPAAGLARAVECQVRCGAQRNLARLAGERAGNPVDLIVHGRTLRVPQAAGDRALLVQGDL